MPKSERIEGFQLSTNSFICALAWHLNYHNKQLHCSLKKFRANFQSKVKLKLIMTPINTCFHSLLLHCLSVYSLIGQTDDFGFERSMLATKLVMNVAKLIGAQLQCY